MTRRLNRRLAALSFLVLFLAVVPGMAYAGSWSGPEGDATIIIPPADAGAQDHSHSHDGHGQPTGIQQCRLGPSKCTGQPSFVSATRIGDRDWTPSPPGLSREITGPEPHIAFQSPVYRMKPPPRAA